MKVPTNTGAQAPEQDTSAPITPAPEASPSAPAPIAAPDPSVAPADAEGDPAEAAAAAYTPNLKFKVLDKEHEMAPYFKDVIKDEKTEKEVRELYEKAMGLDVVKPKYQSTKQELEEVRAERDGLVGGINELRELYQNKDLDSFFGKLKVPFNTLLQYVAEKLEYQELPPEQRQVLDARKQAQRQAYEATKYASSQEQHFTEQMVQAKGYMLDLTLDRADVKSFADSYQGKTGKAFRDAVIEYGTAVFHSRKDAHGQPVDLTPDQAVKELMSHYGALMGVGQAPAATGASPAPHGAQAPAASGTPAKAAPPVIPHVGGRQTSPTTQKPKSLDDLKKLREQAIQG
jgi:hypothetical protein